MRHLVRQLRKKPAHIRERMALVSTALGTLVLVFFWITIVRYEILPKQRLAETRSPFQTLGDIFQNSYKSTVANVASLGGGEPESTGEGKLIVVPQEDIPKKEIIETEEATEGQEEDLEILE